MTTIRTTGLVLAFAGAAGCSAVAPRELVTARSAYDRAANGPAAELNPADLHTSKVSLAAAERSFQESGDTQDTRDLGYIAGRRAELAEARARTIQATTQKEQVIAQMHATTVSQAQRASAELGRTRQLLASQGQLLKNEVERRHDAEKRAAQAAADLTEVATVKQEARGLVITLSGGVLFKSGKADLMPSAQMKLNDVADALTKQDRSSRILVEGYTDSQGTEVSNQELSQRRAQAVRDYLVARGISGDRVTSQGFGQARSIADNGSPEGRANNRRVEIVIQPTEWVQWP